MDTRVEPAYDEVRDASLRSILNSVIHRESE
jgi:hypothetical protein